MTEQLQKALLMKVDGHSYTQIGKALGVSAEQAKALCDEAVVAVKVLETSDTESRRVIELARLEKLRKVLFGQALQGDLKAAAEYDKQSKRYDYLVGLAPQAGAPKKEQPKPEEKVTEAAAEAVAAVDNDTLKRMLSVVNGGK